MFFSLFVYSNSPFEARTLKRLAFGSISYFFSSSFGDVLFQVEY